MAITKIIFAPRGSFLIYFSFLILLPLSLVFGLEWTSLTSFNDVRRMQVYNDTLYLATSGGLLVNDINNTNSTALEITNVDGLGTVDITDVIVDASGQKWVTGMGRLVKFDYNISTPYLFLDEDNEFIKLHTLADDGDNLWVGTEIGLVLFSKVNDGGQIKDSYTLFDSLNPSLQVYDIYLDGNTIWIGTSSGLAYADKTDPVQLKSPSFWKTYDRGRYAELRSDTVNRVEKFEDLFYIGTPRGLFRLERTAVDTFVNVFAGAGAADSSSFTELKVEFDTLFFYSAAQMGYIKDSISTALNTTGLPLRPSTGASTGNFRWVNIRNLNVYQNSSGTYQVYPFTGLPGNFVTGVSVNQNEEITAGFNDKGVGRFAGGQWTTTFLGEPTTRVEPDPSGDTWVGTFGNGLWRVNGLGVTNYDEMNSTMRGNNDLGGEDYVVIYGIKAVGGFLYALCYRALNIYPVAIGDLNNLNILSNWDSLGLSQGINNEFVSTIDVRDQNMAVGTEGIGLYDCYIGPDPSNTSDDFCVNYNTNNSQLPSDAIRIVRYSNIGELWVGTNFGLSRFDFGIERFVNVPLPAGIGPDIRALEFDSRGNAWVGSINGMAIINALNGKGLLYNAANSGLVSDNVNDIHFDGFTGKTYIATDQGISVVSSVIGPPTSDELSVTPFPNPFIIDDANDELEFNYAGNGTIRIYSIAGELIDEFLIGERWRGQNSKNEDVASGVYLFVLTTEDGSVGRGKILLIHK